MTSAKLALATDSSQNFTKLLKCKLPVLNVAFMPCTKFHAQPALRNAMGSNIAAVGGRKRGLGEARKLRF